MKVLRKMLLINWHYFSLEEIHLDQLNFLTGRNAAGKSTLIDALQLVLLGETNNYFFNKAANEKSSRTLEGYLRGEIGDDGGTGFRNLRNGDFNTYVALEFFDEVKQTAFTAGIVFDVYSDGHHKHKYFVYDGPIPHHQFIDQQIPLTLDQLRKSLKKTYANRVQWPDTNRNYREIMMAKMGQIKPKFFSLFKKAVPFTPITDIETFITEYICDVKSNIDMSHMRDNLRSYKRLEQDAQMINERIQRLESIEKSYSDVMTLKSRIQMQSYLVEQGRLALTVEAVDQVHAEIEAAGLNKQALDQQLEMSEEQLQRANKKRDEKIVERAESDAQKRLEAIDRELSRLNDLLRDRMASLSQMIKHLNEYGRHWTQALENQRAAVLTHPGESLIAKESVFSVPLEGLKETAGLLSTLTLGQLERLDSIDLEKTHQMVLEIIAVTKQQHYELSRQLEDINLELQKKELTLKHLKQGIKPFSEEVRKLKALLTDALYKLTGEYVPVTILADALEVRDPLWQPVIEGYLHTQKFNLIVPPEHFEAALSLYDANKQSLGLFGVGLVDVEKIMKQGVTILQGSLAEEIVSENPWAKAYADFLLCRVMTCKSLSDIRKHPISVTATGMLYKNFVASQIDPKRWSTPFIGRKAIETQISLLECDLQNLKLSKDNLHQRCIGIEPLTTLKALNDNELLDMRRKLGTREEIKRTQVSIEDLEKEKLGIDLTYVVQLTESIELLEQEIRQLNEAIKGTSSKSGALVEKLSTLKSIELPKLEKDCKYRTERLLQVYDSAWIQNFGQPRYDKERQSKSVETLIDNFERAAKAEQTTLERRRNELVEHRSQYNRLFHMGHNINDEGNEDYDKALQELRDNKLPQYLSQISDAKDKTYEQFRDEFLAKLKQNFDSIKRQLSELNAAIKACNFGNDQYKYKVEPKPEYRHFYDMITDELLMNEGINLSTYAFREKHGDAIDELFRMILDVENTESADARTELEKNIKRFTDYRSYLNFDLIVTDKEGREQRLSKTLLKKSGGETQTPFYISVLASFAHLYRIHHHSAASNNTIRLIVFDEAFSKMDSQRIKESLQLLRTFKLQAIISAPPDKIPDITPYVDNNLCVIREQDVSFVERFGKTEAGVKS